MKSKQTLESNQEALKWASSLKNRLFMQGESTSTQGQVQGEGRDLCRDHLEQITMGLDLQPDGLTAGLARHCKPDKKIHSLREKKK